MGKMHPDVTIWSQLFFCVTGVEIKETNAQTECYKCTHVTGLLDDLIADTCTPDNFDATQVEKISCENGGKCYVSNDKHQAHPSVFTKEGMWFMYSWNL